MSLRNAFTQGEPIIEIDDNFMKIQNTQHIDGDLKVQLNALQELRIRSKWLGRWKYDYDLEEELI